MAIKNLGRVKGENGKSAYEIWLEQGNTGTEEEFIQSLHGKNGIDGKQGEAGIGIEKIEKTNTVELIDTYTITYTDGTKTTFTVRNGDTGKDYILTETDKEDISKLVEVDIPTKISELENDEGYISNIPTEYITETELNNKGYLTSIPSEYKTKTENDNLYQSKGNYLSSVPLEYVTENELSEKGYATENFVTNKIAEAELSGGEVDLSGLATKDELNSKVDKVKGKSLIDDSEITRLTNVTNYDDTELKNQINSKANKTELHNHSNKTVLDGITSQNIESWNNKSEFEGDYNNLINKPTIPSKVSELSNDEGFISSIPSEYVTETELSAKGYITEHQDLSNYAKTSDIPTKVSELSNDKNYLTNVPSDYKTKTENDSLYQPKGNYLTSYTETDPTVPSHVKNITTTDISNWNNKSNFDGNYNSLTNKPTIPTVPTNISAFNNDKGYLTEHQDLSSYAKKTEIPTVPTALKNPNALIFNIGGTMYSYDGSQAVNIVIEDGSEVSY